MKLSEVSALLAGVPYITTDNARRLYEFVVETRPHECLELGFAHGASSCYIAAAFDELGAGHLTTVDLVSSRTMSPTIEELLQKTGLARYVTPVRETTSYTWFLKKEIERDPTPRYDFCFIDGAKNWTVDSAAFFLVDRLLRTGGWVLFDDYSWTYADQERRTGKTVSDGIVHRDLARDELEQPHVKLIFDLLVMSHPDYSEFRIEDDVWAWAHKIKSSQRSLKIATNASLPAMLVRGIRKMRDAAVARVRPRGP